MSPSEHPRLEYRRGVLRRADLHAEPHQQFAAWFAQALASDQPEPYAMTVATVSPEGQPSARTVLMRGHGVDGLVFYSHYDSHKGRDLAANPRVALLFAWPPLERQVRVEGRVERVSAEASDAYFHSRPRGSQLAALASTPQSGEVASREVLEARLRELEKRYPEGQEIPRPPTWGGFRVIPDAWEFWQGRESRAHDCFRYQREGDGWRIARLMP